MTDNLAIWNALEKTDPKHTKAFKRGGGFTGTAIKPIWIVHMLTKQFGPCGAGWGILNEPMFQVVPGDNREVLVYCTVACWHGTKENVLYGVGGDKVVTYIKANAQYNRPERWESDDEAFKKAFTDAVNNAFKFIGVAADVHMGLFDDDKYVNRVREEFEDKPEPEPVEFITDEQRDLIATLAPAAEVSIQTICEGYNISDLRELPAKKFPALVKRLQAAPETRKAA